MYSVDERDTVIELKDFPQASVGAPCPVVMADENQLVVAYYVGIVDPRWTGSTIGVVDPGSTDEPVAVVAFPSYRAFMFGPPNDEAFSGHPLASRGLSPYSVFEVRQSSWIRGLERMNAVHPYHRPEMFSSLRHFVFAFHDSTFECVAKDYAIEVRRGPVLDALDTMKLRLRAG